MEKDKKEKKKTVVKKVQVKKKENNKTNKKTEKNVVEETTINKQSKKETTFEIIIKLFCLFIIILIISNVFSSFLLNGLTENDYLLDDISLISSCIATIVILCITKMKNVLSNEKKSYKKTLFDGWTIILLAISLFVLGLVFGNRLGFDFPRISHVFGLIIQFLLVGLSEELLFRGLIQTYLINKFGVNYKSIRNCIIISSIIFGFAHISNLSINSNLLAVLIQVVAASCIGLYFGSLYFKNKNIYAVGLLHGIYNIGAGFVTLYFLNCNTTAGTDYGFDSLIIALLLLLPAIYYLSKGYMNSALDKKETLTKEYLEKNQKNYTIITFASMILLVMFISFDFISSFKLSEENAVSDYACMKTEYKELDNFTIHREVVDTYDLYSTDTELKMDDDTFEVISIPYKYNLSVNENGNLFITDTNSGVAKEIKFNDEITLKFAVVQNQDKFTIIAYTINNYFIETPNVYISEYVTLENMKNDSFIDGFVKSFKKVPLSSIDGIGYITVYKDNYNYPVFIDDSSTTYYYIDENGNYFEY